MHKIIAFLAAMCCTEVVAIAQFTKLCSYYGDNTAIVADDICDDASYGNNAEVEKAIDAILSTVGLKRNFLILECPTK